MTAARTRESVTTEVEAWQRVLEGLGSLNDATMALAQHLGGSVVEIIALGVTTDPYRRTEADNAMAAVKKAMTQTEAIQRAIFTLLRIANERAREIGSELADGRRG